MLSNMGMSPMLESNEGSYDEDLEEELGLLLREQHQQEESDRERELNIYRSGSAPPTVEGSLTAVGGLFGHGGHDSLADFAGSRSSNGVLSEEDLRADPAYLSYYYSHVKLNPRLPPPVLSKEDWRFAQRLQAGSSGLGGIGDRRKVNRVDGGGGSSLFSMPPGFSSQKEESEVDSRNTRSSSEWLDSGGDGLIGLSGLGLGGRQKSLADIIQDDLGRASPIPGHPSRPASRNAFDDSAETLISTDAQLGHFDAVCGENAHNVARIQSIEAVVSHPFESSFGASLSRSTTPDPQLMARAPSPHLPPVGVRYTTSDKKSINDLAASLSGMSLSENGILDEENHSPLQIQQEIDDHQNFPFDLQGGERRFEQHSYMKTSESGHLDMPSIPLSTKPSYPHLGKNNGALANQNRSPMMVDGQAELRKSTNTAGSPIHLRNLDGTNAAFTSYGVASVLTAPGMDSRALGGGLPTGLNLTGMTEFQNLNRMGNHAAASAFQELHGKFLCGFTSESLPWVIAFTTEITEAPWGVLFFLNSLLALEALLGTMSETCIFLLA
ncbi:hypothetical protein MRB53_025088 [Persea americana]|uniref:Uncharacterized protein n=1 Tax=Persea americana TaxID=3435 RepID=A0ACC2LEJ7_PERAE|nr:hypothetical protein MRB53_025088 [Persea americana]